MSKKQKARIGRGPSRDSSRAVPMQGVREAVVAIVKSRAQMSKTLHGTGELHVLWANINPNHSSAFPEGAQDLASGVNSAWPLICCRRISMLLVP
jgi:hypothetical protein